MHLTFQLKTSKKDITGKAPIYARITVNGRRKEFSIKRSVDINKWIAKAGVVKGSTEEARSMNSYLNSVRMRLQKHEQSLSEKGLDFSVEDLLNTYFGVEGSKTLIEVFSQHNRQMLALVGKDYAIGTYKRFCTALEHTREFIQFKFIKDDLPLSAINYDFITSFEHYLKTGRNCGHNTTLKYITNLKKVIRICMANGWIKQDPFINYRIRLREVKRDILTLDEIETVMRKQFSSERLNQVKDVFIFSCFTGLAYVDVKKLTKAMVFTGIDKELWLKVYRTKTDTPSLIPLLPPALQILKKYEKHPIVQTSGKLLPVLSNQKMNDYIKEIIAICNINKNVSSHTARHSFSTSVALNNNLPIDTISKILGHSNISITSHYARTLDIKISNDMAPLKEKFLKFAQ